MAPDMGKHRSDDGASADSAADRARVHYLAGDLEEQDAVPGTDSVGADRSELDDLRALLAEPSLWAEPPASLEDAVVALIGAEAAQRSPEAGDAAGVVNAPAASAWGSHEAAPRLAGDPAAVTGAPIDPPIDLAAARTSRAAGAKHKAAWRRPAFLVAAAAAVVAVALSTVLVLRNNTSQPRFDVALAATELAPGATGTAAMVRTDSGWEIKLHATGLPRLDGGNFYQAWLRNADGVLVPIGTFNEGTDVTLWAGVSPKDFGTMTITKESADGNQDSSGQRVLVGKAEPD